MPDLNGIQFVDPDPHFTKGGQGKLFSDPKPTDQHRYQRGYTPERMREVRDAPLNVAQETFGDGQGPHIFNESPFTGPGAPRRVLETIARSTTPVEELRGKNISHLYIRTGSTTPGTASGVYLPDAIHISNNSRTSTALGPIATRHENEIAAGRMLLHELGHHRSRLEGRDHASYDTPVRVGKEEAFADENKIERFRPDPRDHRAGRIVPTSNGYESLRAFKGMGGKTARTAYAKARTTPLDIEAKHV